MENQKEECIIQEISNLTTRLHNLSEFVKTINERFQIHSSEQKLYAFLDKLVDKLLQHQEAKMRNIESK